MNLAIEQLKASIAVADRQKTDARGALQIAQRQVVELTALIEQADARIHECNEAIELLRRPVVKPQESVAKTEHVPARPDGAEVPPPPKKQKPNALTSKG